MDFFSLIYMVTRSGFFFSVMWSLHAYITIIQSVGKVLQVFTLALPLPRSETKILSNSFLHLEQLGLLLLATSTGAAFGATLEIKRGVDNLKTIDGKDASDYRSKMGDFSSMAYLSAGLLLIALVSSAVSSIISSLALSRKWWFYYQKACLPSEFLCIYPGLLTIHKQKGKNFFASVH